MLSDLFFFIPRLQNRRGIALLVTLAVITVIVALSIELHKQKRLAVLSSAESRNQVTLNYMADSGIHIAMAMLIRDRIDSELDSIQEDWAQPEKRNELLADFPFDEGSLEVSISDERGRIQVNALVALPGHEFNPLQFHIWDRLFGFVKKMDETLSDLDHIAIINSVKDWMDTGDDETITGLTGAESDYYESLDPPYSCRNGPVDHLGELFRIKGITTSLMSGTDNANDLMAYLSVNGATAIAQGSYTFDGMININTAPLPVLAALLPEEFEAYAQDLFDYRIEKSDDQYVNSLTESKWYKHVPGLEELDLQADLITAASDLFRIVATATLQEKQRRITALVQRETGKESGKWGCRILRWQID